MADQVSPPDAPFDLQRMIEYSRAMVSALPEATVLVVDRHGVVCIAEGTLLRRPGSDARAVAGRRLDEVLPAANRTMLTERYRATLNGEPQSFDYCTTDGRASCWIQLTPMYFGEAEPAAVIAVIQDITQRQRLTLELQSERERRQAAERMAGLGHWEIDLEAGVVSMSEGSLRLLGTPDGADRFPVASLLERFAPADRPQLMAAIAEAAGSGAAEYECDLHALDGPRRRLLMRGTSNQAVDGRTVITGTAIDITDLRAAEDGQRESEALFRQGFDSSPVGMSLTDAVTGRYLSVNDAFCRLLGRSRDELLGLGFSDVTHSDDAAAEVTARQEMVAGTIAHFESEKRFARTDGSTVWASVHLVPVYRRDGRIRGFFSQALDLTARKEREHQLIREAADLECLDMIRSAVADERLVLHAQPIVDLATGDVVQQELLVRLRREDGEIVAPGGFLPVAERYGAIRAIDQWVTRRAVELAAAGEPVEVNLSAASVGDDEMLATIREALQSSGADPSLVVFEVTETALMADVDRGRRFAESVRELGCRFALDDFGTGYGTFTYLKHIPIDCLKIDIEFVRDLLCNEDDQRLVRAIVTMARDFGKTTIAEGVEDEATMDRLRELGVDCAQGYHIGRPAELACAVG